MLKEDGTINLKESASIILKNSEELAQKHLKFEPASLEEVEQILTLYERLIQKQSLDLPKIACQLSAYSIGFQKGRDGEAQTLFNQLTICYSNQHPSIDRMIPILAHELEHFISNPCPDQPEDWIVSSFSIFQPSKDTFQPLSFSFLEEAMA